MPKVSALKKPVKKKIELPKDPVTQYAQDVLNGKIIAGHLVKLACKRHINDLKRQETKGFPFVFEVIKEDEGSENKVGINWAAKTGNEWVPKKAQKIFRFFTFLRYTDGPKEIVGQPIKLEPFQKFILGSIFGWAHKETGHRRFRKAFIEMARKNGKSTLNSGIDLYMLMADGWHGSQVYATALDKTQAKIVWGEAVKMIRLSPDLKKRLRIRESTNEVFYDAGAGIFRPLAKDTGSINGFNPHCGGVDEYHEHKTDQMIKVLDDGTVMQTESLIFIITTAGLNLKVPCKDEEEYGIKVLNGILENEEYFFFIANLDKDDDKFNPKNWIKANPLVCSTKQGIANLKRLALEAKDRGGEVLRDFLTKNLNEWVDFKSSGYMEYDRWKKCIVDICPDVQGLPAVCGIDLSSSIDLTSCTFEIPLPSGKSVILSHSFIPEDTLEWRRKNDKQPFDFWVQQGFVTTTPGAAVKYDYVLEYIVKMYEKNGWPKGRLGFDQKMATWLEQKLEDLGFTPIAIPQSYGGLSTATKDFRDQCYLENLIVPYNPVLNWAVSNSICRIGPSEDILLDKSKKKTERIDPLAAGINGHVLTMVSVQESAYNNRPAGEKIIAF